MGRYKVGSTVFVITGTNLFSLEREISGTDNVLSYHNLKQGLCCVYVCMRACARSRMLCIVHSVVGILMTVFGCSSGGIKPTRENLSPLRKMYPNATL
jgi:hypothetical protein